LPDCRLRQGGRPEVEAATGWIVPGVLVWTLPPGWEVLERRPCLAAGGDVVFARVAWRDQGPEACGIAEDALFVYGTLMRGESRHRYLGRFRSSTPAIVSGTLLDCGDYPALRLDGAGVVRGELVRLADVEDLRRLDEIEGFGGFEDPSSWFRRTLVTVRLDCGEARLAWVYAGQTALSLARGTILSGDWRAHRRGGG
jgi:gamma-glutamylcyclotransferase (GGCT)/AIG2-like uncharacterized protein YtfP